VSAVTLAVHPGALGDVLLAIPALRALRVMAGAPLVLAAQPRIGALLQTLGIVDRAVAFDTLGLDALFVDDPARSPRLPDLRRLVCWFGARDPVFLRRLTALVPDAVVAPSTPEGGLVWEHLLGTIGAPSGEWCAPAAVPDRPWAEGARALAAAGCEGPRPWLVVHPGAGSAAKCWPAEAFARTITTVASRARVNVAVHAGPADHEATTALRRQIGAGVAWLVEPSLSTLAGALAHATIFLGNDSGVSHLAAALGVPSLALFDARHRAWRPWWPGARTRTVTLTDTVPEEVAGVVAELELMLR
jgi:ADP-heptose:LPS heptosyltransferase